MPKSTSTTKSAAAAKKRGRSKAAIAAQSGPQPGGINLSLGRFFRSRNRELRGQAPPRKLPSAWHITRSAYTVLLGNWKLFLGIIVVYTVLMMILVRGISAGIDIASLKSSLSGGIGDIVGGIGVYTTLVRSAGSNSTQVAGVYQTFLAVIVSLAVIWALREALAGVQRIRVRDAFYKGMYPLIPFLLVMLTIGLQLLPLLIGASLYSLVISNGIAAHLVDRLFWGAVLVVLSAISFYLVTSSIFALYIAALPDMTPMKALRSARELVRYRRLMVLRKILFLPLILLVGSAIIMMPVILLATVLAPWLFFLLSMVGLPIIHAYMYSLYRELLV